MTDKPFEEIIGETQEIELLPTAEYLFDTGGIEHNFELVDGETYRVIYDGTEYICTAGTINIDFVSIVIIGNIEETYLLLFEETYDGTLTSNNEPFTIIYGSAYANKINLIGDINDINNENVSSTHTVGVTHLYTPVIIKPLDTKFLPTLTWDKFQHKPSVISILSEQTVEFETGGLWWEGITPVEKEVLEVGETYTVIYNGETYQYESWSYTSEDGNGNIIEIVCLGNKRIVNSNNEDTGEQLGIICDHLGCISNGVPMFIIADLHDETYPDDGEYHTIERTIQIYLEDDGIEQIPDKYLPFGTEEKTAFEYDGNSEIKEVNYDLLGSTTEYFVKLSDTVLDTEQIIGSVITAHGNGDEADFIITELTPVEFGYNFENLLYFAPKDVTVTCEDGVSTTTLTAGIWCRQISNPDDDDIQSMYAKKMTYTNVRTLDEKFLPKDAITQMIDEYMEEALGGDY